MTEKKELIKKVTEQARLLAITKPEVVKVVREKAEKIGIDTKRITSVKEGEKFKIAQDAKLKLALPIFILEQASSKSLRINRKHMELELEIKVPGLDYDRSLPEGPSKDGMIFTGWNGFFGVILSNGLNDQDPRECQVRVFLPELVFMFPSVLWAFTCVPRDFNDWYTASLELLNLAVYNLYGFFNEVEFVVELDFLQRNNECVIGQTFLEVTNVKHIVYSTKFLRYGYVKYCKKSVKNGHENG
ncbi:hypothetical protein Tco_0427756 [Tanacetum coccineum]